MGQVCLFCFQNSLVSFQMASIWFNHEDVFEHVGNSCCLPSSYSQSLAFRISDVSKQQQQFGVFPVIFWCP